MIKSDIGKFLLLTYLFLMFSLVVMLYWEWFIVPTFMLLPLTYFQSVGLWSFILLFRPIKIENEYDEYNSLRIYNTITKPIYFLIQGFIVHTVINLLT